MHRTQVYLEDGQYQVLRTRARREGRTLASLIREIIDRHIEGKALGEDPFDAAIGIGKGDGSAVAENHAEYLYGDKRP